MSIAELEDVQAWVGGHPDSDQVRTAWEAAEAYVAERTHVDEGPSPAALVQAVYLLTARYLARRNSPEGFVGLGDLGPARVPINDRDVERLIDPWRRFPVA